VQVQADQSDDVPHILQRSDRRAEDLCEQFTIPVTCGKRGLSVTCVGYRDGEEDLTEGGGLGYQEDIVGLPRRRGRPVGGPCRCQPGGYCHSLLSKIENILII
jgi:hypothetical protein